MLIQADDETLLECLVMNADPEHDADFYEFDLKTVTEYRKTVSYTHLWWAGNWRKLTGSQSKWMIPD